MAINSKKKGNAGELEVAELLRQHGFEARRGQQFSGGLDSPDVVSNLGFHIEVKRVESLQLYPAMEQAKRDSNDKDYVVFHRRSRKDWVSILDSRKFLAMVKEYQALKKELEELRFRMEGLEK